MSDLVLSLLALVVITALACAAVVLLGVLPFVRGVDLAEQRGESTVRAGVLCAAS